MGFLYFTEFISYRIGPSSQIKPNCYRVSLDRDNGGEDCWDQRCVKRSFITLLQIFSYRYPTAKLQERDELMRESWVKAMELRLVREELGKCQLGEGVNHYENCKWLAEKYLSMMRENRVCSFFWYHSFDWPGSICRWRDIRSLMYKIYSSFISTVSGHNLYFLVGGYFRNSKVALWALWAFCYCCCFTSGLSPKRSCRIITTLMEFLMLTVSSITTWSTRSKRLVTHSNSNSLSTFISSTVWTINFKDLLANRTI